MLSIALCTCLRNTAVSSNGFHKDFLTAPFLAFSLSVIITDAIWNTEMSSLLPPAKCSAALQAVPGPFFRCWHHSVWEAARPSRWLPNMLNTLACYYLSKNREPPFSPTLVGSGKSMTSMTWCMTHCCSSMKV